MTDDEKKLLIVELALDHRILQCGEHGYCKFQNKSSQFQNKSSHRLFKIGRKDIVIPCFHHVHLYEGLCEEIEL
jgi:hypothetical protein